MSSSVKISVLIPIKGRRHIDGTIASVLFQEGVDLELMVLRNDIDDILVDVFSRDFLFPKACKTVTEVLIKKDGKGNALNIGVSKASNELICVLDADCVLEQGALKRAIEYFIHQDVTCVGGRLLVMYDDSSFLSLVQRLEYMNTFQLSRSVYAVCNAQCLVSGAFGVFRKQDLEEVGLYDTDTVGEDMELILRLQDNNGVRSKRTVVYEKDAVCMTKAPNTLKRLLKQRERWQRGLLDSLKKHKNMIGNPSYGTLGIAMLYQFVFELLGPILVPLLMFGVGALIRINGYDVDIVNSFVIYLVLKIGITCFAKYLESKSVIEVVCSFPEILLATICIMILQIPISLVRIYGMVFFKKRRLIW